MLSDLRALWERLLPTRFDWLQVEVSAGCNASCDYCASSCYASAWHGRIMDSTTFGSLEPAFAATDLVFLQGWGEPLLHPRLWDMVRRVKARGARVGFATNGTLLTPDNVAQMRDTGLDILTVSLAGTSASTHERFRRGCGLSQIGAGLEMLRREMDGHGQSELSVHLAFMLLRSNWQELGRLPDLASEWGVSQVVVSNLALVTRRDLENESLMVASDLWPRVQEELERVKATAAKRGIGLHYYEPCSVQPVCTENVLHACFISYHGDVSPCVMTNLSVVADQQVEHWYRGRSFPLQPMIFGNVNRRSLSDIWTDTASHRFRRAFERRSTMQRPGSAHLPEPCGHCYKLFERMN